MHIEELRVDVNVDIRKGGTKSLGVTLMSQDINNYQFYLRVLQDGELLVMDDSYEVDVLSLFQTSKTRLLTKGTIKSHYVDWKFDPAYISKSEVVKNYVYVRKNGELLVSADANCFIFDVGLSAIDKDVGRVAELYDENYQKHLDGFIELVNFDEIAQSERDRESAETLRQESYDAKVNAAIVGADVVDKVDAKVEELTPQINDLTLQLAQTDGEIIEARGGKPTLGERLDETAAQLAQTAEDIESSSESLYYDSDVINWERKYDELSNTFYYITHVKHQDSDGNIIKMKQHIDQYNTKTARTVADETGATLVTNSSWERPGYYISGLTILDGEIYRYEPVTTEEQEYRYVLAIKGDNTLKVFPSTVDPNYLIANGYENCLTAFTPLIEDGSDVDETLLTVYHMVDKNPRQVIAQLTNKDLVFFTFGGRGYDGDGTTAEETLRIIKENFSDIETAYMLDGGGSNQTVVRGKQINKAIDGGGSIERRRPNHLYFVKEKKKNIERDKDLIETNKSIGEVKYRLDVLTAGHKRRGYIRRLGVTSFLNDWSGTLTFTLFDDGFVYMSGALTVGAKGFSNSQALQLDLDELKPNNFTSFQAYRREPTTLNSIGMVISHTGLLMLMGDNYDEIATGDAIRFTCMYNTGDFLQYIER